MKHGLAIAAQDAPLPVAYDRAKQALAQCERIDECQEWANRAEAMASYYRQAKDFDLEMQARRIRLRAKRRVGELLLQLKGATTSTKRGAGGRLVKGVRADRTVAARAVGLSERQTRAAVSLARIPSEVADAAIDAVPPATEAQLLQIAPVESKFNGHAFCGGPAYQKLMREQSSLASFSYWCQKNPGSGFNLSAAERLRCLKHIAEIRRWIGDFTHAKDSQP